MNGSADKPCAVCGKPRETEVYRPFCSKRCSEVDLQRWLSGRYVVPGQAADEAEAGSFGAGEEG